MERRRLRPVLGAEAPRLQAAEVANLASLLWFGLMLAVRPRFFADSPKNFGLMAQAAAQPVWAAGYLGLGLFCLLALWRDSLVARQGALRLSWLCWFVTAFLGAQGNPFVPFVGLLVADLAGLTVALWKLRLGRADGADGADGAGGEGAA